MKRLLGIAALAFLLTSQYVQAAFRSCGAVATGSSIGASINSPPGVQTNDVVVLILLYATTPTITLPSGFADVTGSPHQFNVVSRNDSGYKMSVATRIAGASEPASYSVTWTGTYAWEGVTCAFSGRNTTTPVTAAQTTSAAGSASPVTVALTGITAVTGDDVLWLPTGSKNSATVPTWAVPAGYTNETQGDFTTAPYPHFDLAVDANVPSGATGTLTGTETGFALDQQGFVVSLAAAAGATCTHAGITSAGAIAVPTADSTVVRLKNGSFGTVDCSTIYYPDQGGAFVTN